MDMAGSGLVGRTEALRRVSAVMDRAAGGVGGVVLVSGEAGIGKTALSDAVLVEAKREGWNTAWVAASSMSTVPGLWPWRQLLAALGGGDLPPAPAGEGDPGAARVAQFDAMLQRLSGAAELVPVLAVLDDAHWADPATLAMVLHFAAASRSVRGCLVVTYRPEDAGSGIARVEVLRLGGLTVGDGPVVVCDESFDGDAAAVGVCTDSDALGPSCYAVRVTDRAERSLEPAFADAAGPAALAEGTCTFAVPVPGAAAALRS